MKIGYRMVLTEITDDNEENHYYDDDNDDDTKHMIYDDAWWSQHLWCSATETCEVRNLRGLHYFTGCWSVREVKFHEQGSKYDNKG